MAKTIFGKYVFAVKETSDGLPWIMLEPSGTEIELPGDGFIGFKLAANTSIKEASAIAAYLNEHIEQVSLTTFDV